MKFIEQTFYYVNYNDLSDILNWMAAENLIPKGKYLVEISW